MQSPGAMISSLRRSLDSFATLAVFVGGWTLDAAEAVTDPDSDLDVLDGLTSLVDKSLVRLNESALSLATGCWRRSASSRSSTWRRVMMRTESKMPTPTTSPTSRKSSNDPCSPHAGASGGCASMQKYQTCELPSCGWIVAATLRVY